MTAPLRPTKETLNTYCNADPASLNIDQAFEVCKQFGSLARWLLDERLLQSAHKRGGRVGVGELTDPTQPLLPEEAGSCWIVYVKPKGSWPCVKPVFVLPFVWRPKSKHQYLSAKLQHEAERAQAAVYAESDSELGEQRKWGLSPNFGKSCDVDLTGLDDVLDSPSGWAAIAAGLILAIEGGLPDRQVWASAAWKPSGGIDIVDKLHEKALFAAKNKATEFYVPQDQVHHVPPISGLKVIGLPMKTVKVRDALDSYTARLDAVPGLPRNTDNEAESASSKVAFERCVEYHLRHPKSDRRRPDFERDFYWTHLYPTILHRQHSNSNDPVTHLVTIVSGNPEVTCLVAEALRPQSVLLLYTTDSNADVSLEPAMAAVKKRLEQKSVRVVPGRFTDDDHMTELKTVVRDFLRGVNAKEIVLDITPGTGLMKYVVNNAVHPEARRVYLRHDSLSTKDRRPKPGSERLVFLRSTDS